MDGYIPQREGHAFDGVAAPPGFCTKGETGNEEGVRQTFS
jgi:hypothetical protein